MGLNFGAGSLFKRDEGFNQREVNPNGCRIYRTADQNVTAGQDTQILYSANKHDEVNMHDGSGNVTIRVRGYYIVTISTYLLMANVSQHSTSIKVDGTTMVRTYFDNPVINSETILNATAVMYLEEGNVITGYFRDLGGGSGCKAKLGAPQTQLVVQRIAIGGL